MALPSNKLRWGDDLDDSDDEDVVTPLQKHLHTSSASGLSKQQSIPPTQYSRIDSHGIQIVTSYKPGRMPGQLIKTVTKQRVEIVPVREPKAVSERKATWTKFGTAAADEKNGTQTTVQSKDEIFLEDPNADTDLQEEDKAQDLTKNLSAFWKRQRERELQRKMGITDDSVAAAAAAVAADGGDGAGGGGAWTKVTGPGGAAASSTGGSASAAASGGGGRYVPPSQRGGGAAASASMGSFKPQARTDDLNTIRVTNLSENTTEADLQELFQRFGRISRVYLAKHKETLQSRGFAFVTFVSKDDAARAMDALQGFGYDHLILKLEWAKPNTPKDPSSSATEFRSGYGKALAQDTKEKVSYASNLTK